jgi:hypothetical protein
MYCAPAKDEKTLFFTLNTASLQGALERVKSGTLESLSPDLASVENVLGEGSQIRIAFLLPETQRTKIREKIDELEAKSQEEPGAGMILGFVKPFRQIKSTAIGILLSNDIGITYSTDLGGEEEALQASTLIETMAFPWIKAGLANMTSPKPSASAESLKIEYDASVIKLSLTLNGEEIRTAIDSIGKVPPDAEAKSNLGAIRSTEVAYMAEWNNWVGNQPFTPVADRKGNSGEVDWENDTRFRLLGFAPMGKVRCSYSLEGGDSPTYEEGFTAIAHCDLDGDGELSIFTISSKSTEITHSGDDM